MIRRDSCVGLSCVAYHATLIVAR